MAKHDPNEHRLVFQALTGGVSGCVVWKKVPREWVLERGWDPRFVGREVAELLRKHGPEALPQKREARDSVGDPEDNFYDVVFPFGNLKNGLYLEVVLRIPDGDTSVVWIVSAHEQSERAKRVAMMSNPIRCDECRERAVVPTILECYSTDLDHDGRAYRVEVHDLPVYRCGACGEVDMDTEAAGRVYDAFRKAIGLMPAAEIRRRRKELGLKQEDMATLLGIAVSTLSRWETGAQMQQRCMDITLRAFFEVPALRDFLIHRAGREDLAAIAGADRAAVLSREAPVGLSG